jgi:hypothetical protein
LYLGNVTYAPRYLTLTHCVKKENDQMRIGKIEAVILAVGFVLAAIAYQVSDKIADSITIEPITLQAATQIQQPAPVILPTQTPIVIEPATPVIVEPTWTPFYQMATVTPTESQARAGWEAPTPSGTTGNHNPGRTDKRTP